MPPVYAIGDIHGQYNKLVTLLKDAQLVGDDVRWTGGEAHLWFLGDFFDRGPDGIGVIEVVMRLQREAADAGGHVGAVIGNHDMSILAAYRFGTSRAFITHLPQSPEAFSAESVDTFTGLWLFNGGEIHDLKRMTAKHVRWLSYLPAMAKVDDRLLMHADSVMYQRYGDSLTEVNKYFRHVLTKGRESEWDLIMDDFNQHRAFITTGGTERAARLLKIFGCMQIIHGHTPIPKITRHEATEPLVYAGGLCVNIDGGLYLGGAGFLHQIT